MSVISRSLAEQVSKKMVKGKVVENEKVMDMLKHELYQAVLKNLPKGILEVAERYKEYFNRETSVRLTGNGFNHEHFYMGKELPCPRSKSAFYIEPTPSQGKTWKKLHNSYSDKKKEIEALRVNIENALVNLRTFKRIKESLPEAIPFLPVAQSSALVVDLSELRKQL